MRLVAMVAGDGDDDVIVVTRMALTEFRALKKEGPSTITENEKELLMISIDPMPTEAD